MTTYKGIKGFTVQSLATDPLASGVAGATWSSGGSLNTARYRGGSSGTQTAGLVFTGRTPSYVTISEQYNGSAWTEVGDVNTAAYFNGGSPAGTTSAALKSTGKNSGSTFQTNVESYNGSSWTEVADVNTARDSVYGAGTSTSNIIAGGQNPPNVALTESWNGSAWTEVGDLNTAKGASSSWGSSNTNALIVGGEDRIGLDRNRRCKYS